MSVRHPKAVEWEDRLKTIFDTIDDFLEEKYGETMVPHPLRPPRGKTPNKEFSGLFNIGASYSLGAGSRFGPGYLVEIRIATVEAVPRELKQRIEEDVETVLVRELKIGFPGQDLSVGKDGGGLKIYGDLSLGIV